MDLSGRKILSEDAAVPPRPGVVVVIVLKIPVGVLAKHERSGACGSEERTKQSNVSAPRLQGRHSWRAEPVCGQRLVFASVAPEREPVPLCHRLLSGR